MKRINKVGPVSLAKVLGALYALTGFIFGLIPAALALIFGAGAVDVPRGGVALVYAAPILLAIFYGIIGVVFGFIGSWLYNLIAKWVGGIEIEIKEEGAATGGE